MEVIYQLMFCYMAGNEKLRAGDMKNLIRQKGKAFARLSVKYDLASRIPFRKTPNRIVKKAQL